MILNLKKISPSHYIAVSSFVLIFLLSPEIIHAQRSSKAKTHTLSPDEEKSAKKDGNTMFNASDFNGSYKAYSELIKKEPNNTDYNYKLGISILMTNNLKSKAVDYLETASKAKDAKKDVLYYLGMAYMNVNRWDDAIEAFNRCKNVAGLKLTKEMTPIDRMVELCYNGKELTANPVDVKFENLGKLTNTPYEEYNPFISADGRKLVFTTRRKGNIGGFIPDLGVFTADIFWTQLRDSGGWAKPKGVGMGINTDWDEETVGLTHDGINMLIYFDNQEAYADIGISMLKGRNWQKPIMMVPNINNKVEEGGACLSNDGSVIYFSSERGGKEAFGGSDLWYCVKQTTGEWSPAQNMGAVINSKYDEINPYISVDGRTLFFCSKGHKCMGGFDIFVTTYDSATKKWSVPKNIGYPVNTAYDEISFSLTGNGRIAYLAAVREGGLGDKDIYRITFNDTSSHPFSALVSGIISSANGGKVELRQASLISKSDNKVANIYRPYYLSNEYVLAAPPGNYILKIEGYGFQPIEEDITLDDASTSTNITKSFSVTLSK